MEKELPSHTYRCLCGEGMHIDPFLAGQLTRCPRCRKFVIVPMEGGGLAGKPDFNLSTSSLRLELAARKHWREIHRINSDPRNFIYEISLPASVKETKQGIRNSSFPSGFSKSGRIIFRVSTIADGRTVGTVSVVFNIPYYSAYLGLMIGKDDQGKGYGTEAVGAVCNFLHSSLNVERITALCDSENTPCRALLEKVGFKQEGVSERFFHHPERGWVDSHVYAFLRPH